MCWASNHQNVYSNCPRAHFRFSSLPTHVLDTHTLSFAGCQQGPAQLASHPSPMSARSHMSLPCGLAILGLSSPSPYKLDSARDSLHCMDLLRLLRPMAGV
jgi:hypothetical protein